MENCSKCGTKMEIISQKKELMECDVEDMTEGQMADYMASEMSGDYGDWAVDVVTYKCQKCGSICVVKYI